MSRQTHVFVGTGQPEAVMAVLENALDCKFIHEEGSDPYIRLGSVAIYIGPHEFDDDDIAFNDGSPIPLHSQYPCWIEVRDTEKDLQRQEAVARQVFDVLKAAGRWPLVLIDDMQHLIDSYDPADPRQELARQATLR
jgi:hypothetical protein